jgi:uncharacterized protein (TIGR04255 family)
MLMPSKILKNKPLVEAIIEVRWQLKSPNPGIQIDPHYKILLGRLYDKVVQKYPEHEQLPTASMPDEVTGQMVHHRFRNGGNDWPLLQVGPGIFTLNDTHKYTWEDFRARAVEAVRNKARSRSYRKALINGSIMPMTSLTIGFSSLSKVNWKGGFPVTNLFGSAV